MVLQMDMHFYQIVSYFPRIFTYLSFYLFIIISSYHSVICNKRTPCTLLVNCWKPLFLQGRVLLSGKQLSMSTGRSLQKKQQPIGIQREGKQAEDQIQKPRTQRKGLGSFVSESKK
ncbi:hypothetical protein XENORESO_011936 [Xenotaenia resolanae]|uniref:Uncharacterized protein n=1 Tax=Xenotaenia resolanae TaxID=208358 RepID=A0ABV0X271_9TELE